MAKKKIKSEEKQTQIITEDIKPIEKPVLIETPVKKYKTVTIETDCGLKVIEVEDRS